MFVKPFVKLSKSDVEIAGGKGASLGEMTQAEIPVPEGFVILSGAFENFLQESGLNPKINAILKGVHHKDIKSVEDGSKQIKKIILHADIPDRIKKEVEIGFSELGSTFVAVRSSATSEDSTTDAWAGQLESYLNTTKSLLLTNVKLCWASLFTPRAIFYRFEKKLNSTKISVAVVVQKMVEPDVSGIAFSVHPVTSNYNELIIEAGLGLGEAIVSGQITPDSYVVDKTDLSIIEKSVSQQKKALVRASAGGNKWISVSKTSKKQKLKDEEILKLSRLIIKIEKHYRFPCDIEWAYKNGKFYILQSRPITTLKARTTTSETPRPDDKFQQLMRNLKKSTFYRELKFPWVPISPVMPYFTAYPNNRYLAKTGKLENAVNITIITDRYESWEKRSGKPIISEKRQIEEVINDCKEFIKRYPPKLVDLQKRMNTASQSDLKAIFDELGEMTVEINRPNVPLNENSFETKDHKLLDELPFIRDQYSEKVITETWNSYNKLMKIISDKRNLDLRKIENLMTEELGLLVSGKEINLPDPRRPLAFIMMNNRTVVYTGGEVLKLKDYLESQDPERKDEETARKTGVITGKAAHPGKVTGKVLKLNEADYFNAAKILEGKKDYILVTPMTRPEVSHYFKDAKAFVTDEGGITAHAVIVAREMNKPCITGTKFATSILETGDLVEVDADNGIVRILKKK